MRALDFNSRLVRWCGLTALSLAAQAAVAAVPDFSGVWERYPPLHVPGTSRDALFGADPVPEGEPPRLREPYAIPYKVQQEKEHAASEEGKPLADSSIQCLPNGMPTMMTGILPIQIVQTRHEMLVIAEELAQLRHIYLSEQLPSMDDIVPGYNGYSAGRFVGRTLVVETVGIRTDVHFLGMPHSEDMKVVERFKLIAPDMLEDRIEIRDPEVLLQPYEFTFTYKKNPHYRLGEYVCDNNQYGVNSDGTVRFDPPSNGGNSK